MKSNQAYVYILILNYNSSKDTIELYNQLQNINYRKYFILVIDNNSTDNSKEILTQSIPLQYLLLNQKNLGYAGGNNIGIKKALSDNADYVWILNPDIRVETDTLRILVEHARKKRGVAAVAPRICNRKNKYTIYSDGGILNIEKGFQTSHLNKNKYICDVNDNIESREVDYVNGSCILIDLSYLDHIGFFREDFFLYFEETEWCLRAINLGFKLESVYKTKCFHRSSSKNFRYFYYMTRNRIYLSIIANRNIKESIKYEINKIRFYLITFRLKIAFFKACGLAHALLILLFNRGLLNT
nr:glycosyltransferase family 2 protein [uncultured Desulfobacter sp.]